MIYKETWNVNWTLELLEISLTVLNCNLQIILLSLFHTVCLQFITRTESSWSAASHQSIWYRNPLPMLEAEPRPVRSPDRILDSILTQSYLFGWVAPLYKIFVKNLICAEEITKWASEDTGSVMPYLRSSSPLGPLCGRYIWWTNSQPAPHKQYRLD
jgi:hypothetical protein